VPAASLSPLLVGKVPGETTIGWGRNLHGLAIGDGPMRQLCGFLGEAPCKSRVILTLLNFVRTFDLDKSVIVKWLSEHAMEIREHGQRRVVALRLARLCGDVKCIAQLSVSAPLNSAVDAEVRAGSR
jgi:hypothetical protein